MEYLGNIRNVTITRLTCSRCGSKRIYDAAELNALVGTDGYFTVRCPRCGAISTYHIDSVTWMVYTVVDNEIEET